MATGKGAVPDPTLWYYELLMFTLDQDEARSGISSLRTVDQLEEELDEEISGSGVNECAEPFEVSSPLGSSSEPQASRSSTPSSTISQRKRASAKQPISWVKKRNELANAVTRFMKDDATENVSSVFGKSIGLELSGIKNMEQTDIAEKLISDVIFLAKRSKFTCDSRIQTDPLQYPSNPIQPQSFNPVNFIPGSNPIYNQFSTTLSHDDSSYRSVHRPSSYEIQPPYSQESSTYIHPTLVNNESFVD